MTETDLEDNGYIEDLEDLEDIRELLSGIPCENGAGDLCVWVEHGDAEAMPELVHARIASGPGLYAPYDYRRKLPYQGPPKTPEWLASQLQEVDAEGAGKRFVRMTTQGILLSWSGPLKLPEALEVFAKLTARLGPDTRWWSNSNEEANSWRSVTSSVKDAVLVAANSTTVVTILGDDND